MPTNPDLPCADCGRLMFRGPGSLPEGQATCRPCRRAKRPPSRTTCLHCGDPLSDVQQRRGGTYCTRNCAFKSGAAQIPAQRDYTRRRYPCTLRPWTHPELAPDFDHPRPPVLLEEPPAPDSEWWLQGPGREYHLIVRYYDDGRVHSRCMICWDEKPYAEQQQVWCGRCLVMVTRHGGST